MKNDEILRRLAEAYREATYGPFEDYDLFTVAVRVESLRRRRGREQSAFSAAIIRAEEAWLGPALLQAAESGKLSQITKALDALEQSRFTTKGRTLAVLDAYTSALDSGRIPTLREVITEMKKVNDVLPTMGKTPQPVPEPRGMLDMLTRLGLPFTPGKDGPRPKERRD